MSSKNVYDRIANYILLKGSNVSDAGLYHGKMGLSLALFFFGRKTGNYIMERYASNLLEDVYDMVYTNMPVGIEYGLSGIGLGIVFLYKNYFVEGNLDDVLEDIDKKIMEYCPLRMKDTSFRSGLQGIMTYIKERKKISNEIGALEDSFIQELSKSIKLQSSSERYTTDFILDLRKPVWKPGQYIDNLLDIDGGSSYYLIQYSYDNILFNTK